MKIVYFTHALSSCWNHGNAHFLRGVLRELGGRGHSVIAYEPQASWSRCNLIAEHGDAPLAAFHAAYPDLHCQCYDRAAPIEAIADADVVIVHEWNEPQLVAAIGEARRRGGGFTLLFHDTHHRAVSDPQAISAFKLDDYDGVLAFGEALAAVYRKRGWGNRVYIWHEAADISLFRPPERDDAREGLVWIGNWGDDERSAELEEFLLRPAREAGLPLDVYGVRYSNEALAALESHGAAYRGWLANVRAPHVFAQHLATVHVPRRFYAGALPGIPTIRVFEALACGVPLVCSPWDDSEGLFRPGVDYLVARSGAEMTRLLSALKHEPGLRASLRANGLSAIRSRHTCAHRVDEFLAVVARLRASQPLGMTA